MKLKTQRTESQREPDQVIVTFVPIRQLKLHATLVTVWGFQSITSAGKHAFYQMSGAASGSGPITDRGKWSPVLRGQPIPRSKRHRADCCVGVLEVIGDQCLRKYFGELDTPLITDTCCNRDFSNLLHPPYREALQYKFEYPPLVFGAKQTDRWIESNNRTQTTTSYFFRFRFNTMKILCRRTLYFATSILRCCLN